ALPSLPVLRGPLPSSGSAPQGGFLQALRRRCRSFALREACLQLAVGRVGFGRHDEIVAVETPDLVRPPRNLHPAPFDDEARVVAFLFGQDAYPSGEGEGVGEVAKSERAHQFPDAVFLDQDRKSTRLNSSHVKISYAVFCMNKKIKK